MNGDNFDSASHETHPKLEPFVPIPKHLEESVAFVSKNLFEHLKKHASDSMLYLCPKCQKKSHYDPKEFHGLCPACWTEMDDIDRAALSGSWYQECANAGCDFHTVAQEEWTSTHGYCQECWTKLTPEQRCILQGIEPPLTQETRIVRLPAIPSLWKVYGVSMLATVSALAAFAVVWYYLVWHMR